MAVNAILERRVGRKLLQISCKGSLIATQIFQSNCLWFFISLQPISLIPFLKVSSPFSKLLAQQAKLTLCVYLCPSSLARYLAISLFFCPFVSYDMVCQELCISWLHFITLCVSEKMHKIFCWLLLPQLTCCYPLIDWILHRHSPVIK